MEIVVAVIFVQNFIWASLLLRKPSKHSSPIVSFLSLFLIYLLLYINTVFGKYIPLGLIPACTLILAISISYFQIKNLHLKLSLADQALLGTLLVLSVLLLVYSNRNGSESEFYWRGIAIIGSVSLVYDTCLFIRYHRKKTIAGSLLKDFRFKMSFIFLLDKILVLLYASFILLFSSRYENSLSALRIIFHFLAAILSFITGYLAVTASFHTDVQKKKKYRRNMSSQDNTGLIEKLRSLMQEQKPFLDCELTLEKMSRMLELSEHELTSLLNHEMDTSFYKLVNDYRMETVLKKLKTSDHGKFTIMASAYESGFNSKSTFYRIFKEYTGMTPGEFLEKD